MLKSLSRSDKSLVQQLLVIAVSSVVVTLAGSNYAERAVLAHEADWKATQTSEFLKGHLSNLPETLIYGRLGPHDLMILQDAAIVGEAFRYKLYDANGRVVVSSREEDIGKRNTKGYFKSILRSGESLFRIDRRPWNGIFGDALGVPYAQDARVIGKRYVPIKEDGKVLGIIEVYLDMTALDSRLRSNSRLFVCGMLVVLTMIGLTCAAFIRRNIRERHKSIQELEDSKKRAEQLASQISNMLESLRLAEEDKMSRVVGLVDGISHEIGNPLATLSMGLDAVEARFGETLDSDSGDLHLRDMRDALYHVGAFLHRLTALSDADGEMSDDVDVNGIIRTLIGLVQLDERTREAFFELNLSPDVRALSLPNRPVLLSLFIVFSSVAECVCGGRGRKIEVETRMSDDRKLIEVNVSTTNQEETTFSPNENCTLKLNPDHPALNTARRIVESLGGRMEVSSDANGAGVYNVSLPNV